MLATKKIASAAPTLLLASALVLGAGCSRDTEASLAERESPQAAAEAARNAALATGAAQMAVDDLVSANEALLRRVEDLESQLARTQQASAAPAERVVVERTLRVEDRAPSAPPAAAPAPPADLGDRDAGDATDAGYEPVASEPAYSIRTAEPARDDGWRTRTVLHDARDLPRREPARDVRPPREPAYRRVTVEAGTPIAIEILDPISTRYSEAGERFRARLAGDLLAADGRVAVRDGAEIRGTVADVRGSRRIGGRPALAIALDSIELPDGSNAPLDASWSVRGKSQTPKDAATIGGATVGGAILGRIFDKGEGEVLGGLLGAAAGTAVAREKVGQPIVLEPGEVVSMTLRAPLEVRVRR